MKHIKLLLAIMLAATLSLLALTACGGDNGGNQAQEEPLSGESSVLVTYFSWSSSNNTRTMAHYIADATEGEVFRIVPETPYTTDYEAVIDLAQDERDSNARPALASDLTAEQLAGYDVIFIGYPIWWYDAPMIIYTFVEAHDFTGKTIVPFATSSSSGFSGSDEKIKEKCAGATVLEGLRLRSSEIANGRERVNEWIASLDLS